MKKTLYLLFVIGALSSCQSLLDIPQQGVLNMDTFYKTDEDAQQALAAVYNEWAYKFAFSNFHCKLLMADDTWQGGNGPADGASGAALSRAYYDSSNEKIKFMYEGYYIIINRANLLLDSFKDSADTKIKKQAVAEARFFRAWAYYELVTMWDNPPLVKKVLGSDEGKVTNTPGEETWQFLEDELKDIISGGNLTEKVDGTPDAETCAECDDEGLQDVDCGIEEIHISYAGIVSMVLISRSPNCKKPEHSIPASPFLY